MNFLEDPAVVSPLLLNAIDYLLLKNKDLVFGGSLAVNAVGIIKRPIKDLDIIIPNREIATDLFNEILKVHPDTDELYEDLTDVNGEPVVRVGGKIHEVPVCFFVNKSISFSTFGFLGRKININNVNDIILAKLSYMQKPGKSFEKHQGDVYAYEYFFKCKYPLA